MSITYSRMIIVIFPYWLYCSGTSCMLITTSVISVNANWGHYIHLPPRDYFAQYNRSPVLIETT